VGGNRAWQDRRTALHLAAEKGHLEVVRCLLQNGGDVAAVNQV
jgi:ankyrin repeat protein